MSLLSGKTNITILNHISGAIFFTLGLWVTLLLIIIFFTIAVRAQYATLSEVRDDSAFHLANSTRLNFMQLDSTVNKIQSGATYEPAPGPDINPFGQAGEDD